MKGRTIAGAALAVSVVWAQAAAPAFEVASIRPASLPTPDTFRSGQFRAGMQLDEGSLNWGFASLADVLPYAFRVKNFQVAGPEWMRESRWNILAKLPQGATTDQAPEMMQALLADRFKLAYHHEKREQPVYELVVAKGGSKLEADPVDPAAASAAAAAGANSNGNAPGFFPGPFGGAFGRGGGNATEVQDGKGGRGMMITGGANGATTRISPGENCEIHMDLTKLTMQDFADMLTPFLDRPVLDSTELKGGFKVTLDLPMEAMMGMMQNMIRTAGLPPPGQGGFGGPGGRGPGDGGGPPGGRGLGPGCPDPGALLAGASDASNAPIFQAVQKLGLRLEARKAPFDTIVVDHLEKTPSDN